MYDTLPKYIFVVYICTSGQSLHCIARDITEHFYLLKYWQLYCDGESA